MSSLRSEKKGKNNDEIYHTLEHCRPRVVTPMAVELA